MSLTDDQLLAIQKLVVEPVDRANREAISEIRQLLDSNVVDQSKQLRNHEDRIAGLEAIKHKALAVWTAIIAAVTFATTFAAKAIWDEWLRPYFSAHK